MNTRLSTLLTSAILSGMLASQGAKAEGDKKPESAGAKAADDKHKCKGMGAGEKGSCCSDEKLKKMKEDGKSGCCGKGGCGGKSNSADIKVEEAKTPVDAKAPVKGK